MTANPANTMQEDMAKARKWLGSSNTKRRLDNTLGADPPSEGACTCPFKLGKVLMAPNANTLTMRAMAKNGACQLKYETKKSANGTPATVATEKDVMTTLMARPLRSKGMTSATMVWDKAIKTPPKKPEATRAVMSQA